MRIGLVQTEGAPRKQKNIEKVLDFVEEAARKGAEIVCLQELFSTQYFCVVQNLKYFDLAEPIPGPTTNRLATQARKKKVAIIAPIFEADTQVPGTFYNSAAIIDRNGKIVGKYRKTHLPQLTGYHEKFYFKPGNLGYPVFEAKGNKFGVVICYDRHFEEGPRIEALKGAELVFVPTCTGFYPELWELELRAHAAFNTMFVAGINRCGIEFPQQPAKYYGRSIVVDPKGKIIAKAGEDEQVLVSDVDLRQVVERRKEAPFLRDRRPDLYGELSQFM
jgi:N-carbamoylputrescine amidase